MMNLEKLKGAAEVMGCRLFYNRSLGFYEIHKNQAKIKYISKEIIQSMDVQTFKSAFLDRKELNVRNNRRIND